MSNCIDCYYNACELLVCNNTATLTLPYIAEQSGIYRIILEYQNTAKQYEVDLAQGSAFKIDLNCLNENYCYTGYLMKPDGVTAILFADKTYSGFSFCTKQISIC